MIKAFWILYDIILLVGLAMSIIKAYINCRRYRYGRKNYQIIGNRCVDKEMDVESARKWTMSKRRNALWQGISYITLALIFNYAFIDILFRKIIGG